MGDGSIIVRREIERLGPFELVSRIGTGGFCEIYLARQYGADGWVKDVCLKRLLPEHAHERDCVGSLRDEAILQASIAHRNIVRVHDFRKIDGQHVVVMDYVDGASLAQIIRWCRSNDRLLAPSIAVHLMCKVLFALSAAHRLVRLGHPQQVIHRDVTPRNIMVDREGDPVLIDFGIAKARDRAYRTESGAVRGTDSYMAPETIMSGIDGYPHVEDARTDVYTVGVVLYQLLSGEHPYSKSAPDKEVAPLIVKGEHRALARIAPQLPNGLADVVERLMAVDPTHRPADAFRAARLLAPFVPPDVEARIELAGVVARALDGRPSLAGGYHAPAEQVSASTAPPGVSAAPVIDTARLRRPRNLSPWSSSKALRRPATWVFAGLVLAALGVLAWSAKSDATRAGSAPRPESVPAETPAPALAAAERQASADRPTATDAPAAETENSPAAATTAPLEGAPVAHGERAGAARATPPGHGALAPPDGARQPSRIAVLAGGPGTWEVWVDEAYMGETPASVVVAPGVHRVSIGKGQPTLHKTVRVAARQTKSVRFLP